MVTHSDEESGELDGGHFDGGTERASARERADVCSCCLDRPSQVEIINPPSTRLQPMSLYTIQNLATGQKLKTPHDHDLLV